MNKKTERIIIIFLVLVLLGIGLGGCASNQSSKTTEKSVYASDSIGIVLGCVFDPANCKKYKKEADQNQITKEFDEVDKAKQSEGK